MSNLIHWWELSTTTRIGLSNEFLQMLSNKRKELQLSQLKLAKLMGVHEATIRCWEKNKRRPNKIYLLKLLKILNISKMEVYGNIKFIRGKGKSLTIFDPQLPYKERSEHVQILAHGFFDGTLGHESEKSIGGLIYQSTSKLEQEMFKKLVERSKFGKFRLSKNNRGEYCLPAILTYAIMNHYGIYTLNSIKSAFSKKLKRNLRKIEWKKNLLKSAYIDEGSCGEKVVRDNLCVFSSVNPKLVKQVSQILRSLKWEFFVYEGKEATSIILKSKSLKKFYKDIILSLPKDYHKRINAERLLKKQERADNIKKQLQKVEKIIKKSGQIKVREVQELLHIHEASARRRIEALIKLSYIKKKAHGKYEINNKQSSPPSGRGLGRKSSFQ